MHAADLFRLDGRVALITGASSGLGERMAEVAAANGAKVVLVARRPDRLKAVQARIEAAGGTALTVAADVTDLGAMVKAFDMAEAAFGTVDILVANAGIGRGGPASEVTPETLREVLSTNLEAVFFWSQEAARRLAAAGKPGSIITISSIAGLMVHPNLPAYGIAKAAVVQATRSLALDYGRHQIRVNAIAPGWIVTDMNRDYLLSPDGLAMGASLPLGHYGDRSDLDGPFLLLASDAGRLITGATLVVDSGNALL